MTLLAQSRSPRSVLFGATIFMLLLPPLTFLGCASGTTGGHSSCGNGTIEEGEACEPGVSPNESCALHGFSTGQVQCVNCQLDYTDCSDGPDPSCNPGNQDTRSCGVAPVGTQTRDCIGGTWGPWSYCRLDDETCTNGDQKELPCGTTGLGLQQFQCVSGKWQSLNDCTTPPTPGTDTTVFINEIHYDNDGTDAGEKIGIAGPAGTSLEGWKVVLYNGADQKLYDQNPTIPLNGTLSDQDGSGYGVRAFDAVDLQNGPNDGIALLNPQDQLIQLLSYEGTFTAADGPAAGRSSEDIGVAEPTSTPVGHSLQLGGCGTSYTDFKWQSASAGTFGSINANQTFSRTCP